MRSIVLIAVACTLSVPTVAQRGLEMPPEYKEVQVKKLEVQHSLLRAMADSMPERWYRDRATPSQRDFAEQVYHAASSVVFIVAEFAVDTEAPAAPDTSRMLSSKAQMLQYLDTTFRWATQQLRNQPDSERSVNVSMFGYNMPRWQVWDEIHQHTIWTAGAIVANFRKHGMAPPGFAFF